VPPSQNGEGASHPQTHKEHEHYQSVLCPGATWQLHRHNNTTILHMTQSTSPHTCI
jgi:hypothetical protein